jgi:hypothetical protein
MRLLIPSDAANLRRSRGEGQLAQISLELSG